MIRELMIIWRLIFSKEYLIAFQDNRGHYIIDGVGFNEAIIISRKDDKLEGISEINTDYLVMVNYGEVTELFVNSTGGSPYINQAVDNFNEMANGEDTTNILNNLN